MNENNKRKLEDAIMDMLGLTHEDINSWEDHDKVVDAAEDELTYGETLAGKSDHTTDPMEDIVDLSAMTTHEKMAAIIDDMCDKVLTGELLIESGQELLTMTKVVSMLEEV